MSQDTSSSTSHEAETLPSSTSQADSQPDATKTKKKRNHVIFKILLSFLLIGGLWFSYWYFYSRFYESTNDAYVNGNSVTLMSAVPGITVAIYTDNAEFVEQNQLLVELDITTYELAFHKAQVELATKTRQVRQLWEDVRENEADVALKKVDLQRTLEDYESRLQLKNTEAISREDLTHAYANYGVAQSAVKLAEHKLHAAIATLGTTTLDEHPLIQEAAVVLKEAYVNLMRCEILAPVSGMVAQRNVQVGEWITQTRALMSIIPLNQIWIDANFKETQLGNIRIGQPVTVTSDIYGSKVVYHGKVQGIVAGTGSIFSLIPPQNATGNWIKIVQRVPVRIDLDPEEIKAHPLFLGLSTYVTVDVSDISGPQLADRPLYLPQLTTNAFTVDMKPVNELIQDIIKDNLHYLRQSDQLNQPPQPL